MITSTTAVAPAPETKLVADVYCGVGDVGQVARGEKGRARAAEVAHLHAAAEQVLQNHRIGGAGRRCSVSVRDAVADAGDVGRLARLGGAGGRHQHQGKRERGQQMRQRNPGRHPASLASLSMKIIPWYSRLMTRSRRSISFATLTLGVALATTRTFAGQIEPLPPAPLPAAPAAPADVAAGPGRRAEDAPAASPPRCSTRARGTATRGRTTGHRPVHGLDDRRQDVRQLDPDRRAGDVPAGRRHQGLGRRAAADGQGREAALLDPGQPGLRRHARAAGRAGRDAGVRRRAAGFQARRAATRDARRRGGGTQGRQEDRLRIGVQDPQARQGQGTPHRQQHRRGPLHAAGRPTASCSTARSRAANRPPSPWTASSRAGRRGCNSWSSATRPGSGFPARSPTAKSRADRARRPARWCSTSSSWRSSRNPQKGSVHARVQRPGNFPFSRSPRVPRPWPPPEARVAAACPSTSTPASREASPSEMRRFVRVDRQHGDLDRFARL